MKKLFAKFFAKTWRKIFFIATASLLVLLYVATIVLTTNEFLSGTMDTVFAPGARVLKSGDPSKYTYFTTDEGITDKVSALAHGNSVNEEITAEGFTLLKNDNNVLPFTRNSRIHVFGQNSVNIVYGGSGSGGMDASKAISVADSLKSVGFTVNEDLVNLYKRSGYGRPASPAISAISYYLPGFATGEAPISIYNDTIRSTFVQTDPAIVVFSRVGGESFDLPRSSYDKKGKSTNGKITGAANESDHYLQLDANERALLDMVCNSFDKVVVVVNSSATLELGDLEDNDKLDGILWIGNPGGTGINSLGKILCGDIAPSGRTVDTYARNFKLDPSFQNISDFSQFYNGESQHNLFLVDGKPQKTTARFVEYEEGIYVGYRYYETRGFVENDNFAWYNENVVYPFGYGLSYADDLNWEITAVRVNGAEKPLNDIGAINDSSSIEIDVKVTNPSTNSYEKAVKDVVQLYFSAPYIENGIEKSHVVLADFAKTSDLARNENETVTLKVTGFEMASFDFDDKNNDTHKGYELDAGNYRICVARNAHDASVKIASEMGGTDEALVVNANVADTIDINKDPSNNKDVGVKFADVSAHFTETGSKSQLMSRADFAGTFPTHPTDETRTVSKAFLETLKPDLSEDATDPWYSATAPKQSNRELRYNEAMQLHEMRGLDYDDPNWDKFLDQLTYDQMLKLVGTGNFNTAGLDNIGKPRTMEPDGPAGYTNFMAVSDDLKPVYETTFYASECVIAATWSKELVHKMGVAIGNESIIGNARGDGTPYSGWYAPAMNIHRSQFSGRNFEYYSEDGVLSGKIAAEVVKGAAEKGTYTYLKHFAVNDQEADRDTYGGLVTWLSEQAMREIYFKPFEIAVKEGKSRGVMSSFNRIGTVWAGANYNLLTGVLRNEWGFKGSVVTDYIIEDTSPNKYKFNVTQMLNAGGDIVLNQSFRPDAKTTTEKTNLRRAAKNILYVTANSNAMNGYGPGVYYGTAMASWMVLLLVVVGSLTVLFLGLDVLFMFLANKSITDEQLEQMIAAKKAKKEAKKAKKA